MSNSFTKASKRLAGAAFEALRRLGGVLTVAAGAVVVWVALHYICELALGSRAQALYPEQRLLGLDIYAKIWGKMAAIDRFHHLGQLPPNTRLGIVIGNSATQTGIERWVLDASATTAADRWIVLTGAGMSFKNLESVMQPVLFCSLKPTVVVMGVNPQMLVGEGYRPDQGAVEIGMPVVGRRDRALNSRWPVLRMLRAQWAKVEPDVKRTLRAHWAVRNHAVVSSYLHSWTYGFRLLIFHAAGVSAERLFAPAFEPWDDIPIWWWYSESANEELAQEQIVFWEQEGHFKAASYDPDGPQARSFVRMLRGYRNLGAKLYIVVVPLRSNLRERVPREAKQCLFEVLKRNFPDDPPPVCDLEQAIPDHYFADEAHLSRRGADKLSTMVAQWLEKESL